MNLSGGRGASSQQLGSLAEFIAKAIALASKYRTELLLGEPKP